MIKSFRFDLMFPWTQERNPWHFWFKVHIFQWFWIFLYLRHITRARKPIFSCWTLEITSLKGSRVNLISRSWSGTMFGLSGCGVWYICKTIDNEWNLCSDYEDTKFGILFSFTILNLSYHTASINMYRRPEEIHNFKCILGPRIITPAWHRVSRRE